MKTKPIKLEGFKASAPTKKQSEICSDITAYFADEFNSHVRMNLDVDVMKYDHYGLMVIAIDDNCNAESINPQWLLPCDGSEWAVTNSSGELETACKEYIRQTIWAFNADFLACHIDGLTAEDVNNLRGDKCEDINEAFYKLLDDFDSFAEDAISADGIGHLMGSYDGELREWGDVFAIRIN